MEPELKITEQNFKKNTGRKWLFSILLVTAAFIVVLICISPLAKIKEFNKIVYSDSLFVQKYEMAYNDSSVANRIREKTYKEALLSMADGDSINMIVNARDSVICLSMHGVIIHQTKMSDIRIDHFLKKLPQMYYVKIFSRPLKVNNDYATIVKEPIVEREAPKDTLEALLTAYTPDTLVHDPAFAIMRLDHDINIILAQDDNPLLMDKLTMVYFNAERLIKRSWYTIAGIFSLKGQNYTPVIKIKLPAGDLRAIYRALPARPDVVIYYGQGLK